MRHFRFQIKTGTALLPTRAAYRYDDPPAVRDYSREFIDTWMGWPSTKRTTPFGVALFALSTKEVYDMSNDRITENGAANFKAGLRAAYGQQKDLRLRRQGLPR